MGSYAKILEEALRPEMVECCALPVLLYMEGCQAFSSDDCDDCMVSNLGQVGALNRAYIKGFFYE